MANTLSVMTNVLRNVVSKQRRRYKEKGFNLDLAYICDNIIAMGYPADNIESIYRNRIDDVYNFFEAIHPHHYKIYNLCSERSYDINKFHGRVALYPFEDHNPPTIELIQKFCNDVDCWLKSDIMNIAAIHCKAGKGRTGTMICCYLLYCGLQSSAEDALAYYDEKRTKDRKGVTIPSQRRYVQYFSRLVANGSPYTRTTLQLCEIRFSEASVLQNQSSIYCSISTLHDINSAVQVQILKTLPVDFRKSLILDFRNSGLAIAGDIKVELFHKTSKKKFFHFWFNTYFVCDNTEHEDGTDSKLIYTLLKSEIDDAHKDKDHRCFSEDFKVQLVFMPHAKHNSNDSKSKNDANVSNIRQSYKTENPISQRSMHNQTSNLEHTLHLTNKYVVSEFVGGFVGNVNKVDMRAGKNICSETNISDVVVDSASQLFSATDQTAVITKPAHSKKQMEISNTDNEFLKPIVNQPPQLQLSLPPRQLSSPSTLRVTRNCKASTNMHNNSSNLINAIHKKQELCIDKDDFQNYTKQQQNYTDQIIASPLVSFAEDHRNKNVFHQKKRLHMGMQKTLDCEISNSPAHPAIINRTKTDPRHVNYDIGSNNILIDGTEISNNKNCSNPSTSSSFSSQSSPSVVGDEEDWESGESSSAKSSLFPYTNLISSCKIKSDDDDDGDSNNIIKSYKIDDNNANALGGLYIVCSDASHNRPSTSVMSKISANSLPIVLQLSKELLTFTEKCAIAIVKTSYYTTTYFYGILPYIEQCYTCRNSPEKYTETSTCKCRSFNESNFFGCLSGQAEKALKINKLDINEEAFSLIRILSNELSLTSPLSGKITVGKYNEDIIFNIKGKRSITAHSKPFIFFNLNNTLSKHRLPYVSMSVGTAKTCNIFRMQNFKSLPFPLNVCALGRTNIINASIDISTQKCKIKTNNKTNLLPEFQRGHNNIRNYTLLEGFTQKRSCSHQKVGHPFFPTSSSFSSTAAQALKMLHTKRYTAVKEKPFKPNILFCLNGAYKTLSEAPGIIIEKNLMLDYDDLYSSCDKKSVTNMSPCKSLCHFNKIRGESVYKFSLITPGFSSCEINSVSFISPVKSAVTINTNEVVVKPVDADSIRFAMIEKKEKKIEIPIFKPFAVENNNYEKCRKNCLEYKNLRSSIHCTCTSKVISISSPPNIQERFSFVPGETDNGQDKMSYCCFFDNTKSICSSDKLNPKENFFKGNKIILQIKQDHESQKDMKNTK